MNFKKSDSEDGHPSSKFSDSALTDMSPVQHKLESSYKAGEKIRTSGGNNIECFEIFAFRSILEKLTCVDQEDFTWTWDHETGTFLIQAQNNVIEQYISILTHELGEALCLHLKKVSIIVDLRPWKTNPDRTSLRIGFEGSHIPAELCGFTGLEDLVKLHFVSLPEDSPNIKKSLKDFEIMCYRIDSLLERKLEWMWERHWKNDGLAFAVVRAHAWMNNYVLVEKEIEFFNNSPANKQAGAHVELSTYNRGTSFNVRIALDGFSNNLRKDTSVLEVFDTHFSGSIS
jgi:hypothetical protein